MGSDHKNPIDGPLIFKGEEKKSVKKEMLPASPDKPWKLLIVDDEEEVHDITRITLKDFSFEGRQLSLFSAYSGQEVRNILADNDDIAMILLDVVMEEEDTGLKLVKHIRDDLDNHAVRIVLRTGQPGKAPEQTVITQYDINDYKTKPEFTAQKLFTSVTACLRAYQNLKTIERNRQGLESIIASSSLVFKHQSFYKFGYRVLEQLNSILKLGDGQGPASGTTSETTSGYFIGFPTGQVLMMAGTGDYSNMDGTPIEEVLPKSILDLYKDFSLDGGESFLSDEYIGVFKSKEGFTSLLYLKKTGGFSSEDQYLLRIYANNISIGFDNISLAREIINTQKEVILTLGEVVETRSQETANHVTRVAEVCYLLAKKYGMDEDRAELLRLAAPMHDVGKIGVPEAILHKPGKLTAEEFDIMKDHARIGYEILCKSGRSIMKTAAITALQHHERWDGDGYPQGLRGDDIHIFGRIAAIADVFDALSHKRCYKDAWSIEKIVAYFEEASGSHFDSDLVDLFLGNINEFKGINRRFPE